ncbi:hypothetical protein D5F53_05735 [Paenibacillus lautus]|jgi:hypothetical protein|uniref:Uncharacterized protein n=1 Tax=Paenibacillus lautus TaxID=1401 RepID=A0A385TGQ7_PAELA|nr:hypothetical protein D5F53_05735 [Paenibacillus lautus]
MTVLGFAVCCLVAGVISVKIMRKQRYKQFDTDTSEKVITHPMRSNPIIILYWLTPFLMIVGGFLLGMYYNWGQGD